MDSWIAGVVTEMGAGVDTFFGEEIGGEKIRDSNRLEEVSEALSAARRNEAKPKTERQSDNSNSSDLRAGRARFFMARRLRIPANTRPPRVLNLIPLGGDPVWALLSSKTQGRGRRFDVIPGLLKILTQNRQMAHFAA